MPEKCPIPDPCPRINCREVTANFACLLCDDELMASMGPKERSATYLLLFQLMTSVGALDAELDKYMAEATILSETLYTDPRDIHIMKKLGRIEECMWALGAITTVWAHAFASYRDRMTYDTLSPRSLTLE